MATYYCGPGGNDGNAGTSFALRKASFAAGLALVAAAGDELRVCASQASELDITSAGILAASGTDDNPIRIVGASTADGSIDGTLAYIDGQNTAVNILTDNGVARVCVLLQNLMFRRATSSGLYVANSSSRGWLALNCTADANGSHGFEAFSGRQAAFRKCFATNNAGSGFHTVGVVIGCSASGNARGIGNPTANATRAPTAIGNRLFNNTGGGIEIDIASTDNDPPTVIVRNWISGNGGDGILFDDNDSGALQAIDQNWIVGNGGYGIRCASGTLTLPLGRNYFRGNTSGETSGIAVLGGWTTTDMGVF